MDVTQQRGWRQSVNTSGYRMRQPFDKEERVRRKYSLDEDDKHV